MTGRRLAELQELAELAAASVPTEAYLEEYQLLEAIIDEAGAVRTALRRTRGAGVRAVAKGAVGFAHTTDCTVTGLRRARDEAARAAALGPDTGEELPCDRRPTPPGCWSHESLRDVSARRAVGLLQEIRVGAEEVAGASFVRGSIAIGHRLVRLASTHETRREWHASYFCMAARAVAGNGDRRASVEIQEYGRNLDHLAPARLGELVASQAASALRGTPLASGRYPVLLAPRVTARLLAGWAAVWCANPARAMMSAGPAVTLVDDPLLDREIGSRPFDDEGIVCRRKVLIDRGTAVETLGDWRSARQAGLGAAAAGNAVRGSYTQLPSPAPSVLVLSPDQDRSGQLTDGIEDGLAVHRVHYGRGGVDVGRGIYQLPVSGRRIRRGELAEEVSGMVLAGSLGQFLSSVEAVGGELRCFGPIACPSLRLGQAQLIRN